MRSSDWKDGFLFVGNHLALDFVNTLPIQDGMPIELLSDFSDCVRWMQAAGLIHANDAARLHKEWGDSPRSQRMVEGARELRERLRKEIIRWENGDAIQNATVAELNRLMRDYPMMTRLKMKEKCFATDSWFEPIRPENLFAPLAYGATMLFANEDRTRVRQCGNCVLHFLDTSKKGTRRWCSMQLCGNRLKVAAYAARQRKG